MAIFFFCVIVCLYIFCICPWYRNINLYKQFFLKFRDAFALLYILFIPFLYYVILSSVRPSYLSGKNPLILHNNYLLKVRF